MPTLAAMCRNEVMCTVPDNVIQSGLALWSFCYDLPEWMDNSPVPITVELPIEP